MRFFYEQFVYGCLITIYFEKWIVTKKKSKNLNNSKKNITEVVEKGLNIPSLGSYRMSQSEAKIKKSKSKKHI